MNPCEVQHMSQEAKVKITSLILLLGLLIPCGCTSQKNQSSTFADGSHPAGWLPAGHMTAATTNLTTCTQCHGSDLSGGISQVSCTSCHIGTATSVHPVSWGTGSQIALNHAPYVTANSDTSCHNTYCHGSTLSGVANSGPSCTSCHLGGVTSVHPADWSGSILTLHGVYAAANTTSACANMVCHGTNLGGVTGSGPSCTSCHIGGPTSGHPSDWTTPIALDHASYVQANGTSGCANANCHGANLTGVAGSGPSCTSCHIGGVISVHPVSWGTGTQVDLNHASYVADNGNIACQNNYCHGSTLTGVTNSGPSCTSCHLGGVASVHPSDWASDILTQHGVYAAANTTNACANASCHGSSLTGVTGSGPSCTSCHIGGPTSGHPTDWTTPIALDHASYVQTNGTSGCANANCHGSSLMGVIGSGPSCTSCHIGGATSVHPVSWGTGSQLIINHSPYVATNSSTACQNNYCHGSTLTGVTNSGPGCNSCHVNGVFPFTATGCVSCHGSPPTTPDAHNTVTGHFAPQVTLPDGCNTCHNGAGSGTIYHFDGIVEVNIMSPVYNAETGTAVYNSDNTCSNVSCHGGQTTPNWTTGSLDVNTSCTSCHTYGTAAQTPQYNSFYSGQHNFHVNIQGFGCTDCHSTVYLAVNHFTNLNTSVMEGPASATLLDTLNYNGVSCSPSCHPSSWPPIDWAQAQ